MRRSTEGARARAQLPDGVEPGAFGPRLRATVGILGCDAALAPCNLDPAARLCSARKPASARSRNILKQHAAEAPDVAAL